MRKSIVAIVAVMMLLGATVKANALTDPSKLVLGGKYRLGMSVSEVESNYGRPFDLKERFAGKDIFFYADERDSISRDWFIFDAEKKLVGAGTFIYGSNHLSSSEVSMYRTFLELRYGPADGARETDNVHIFTWGTTLIRTNNGFEPKRDRANITVVFSKTGKDIGILMVLDSPKNKLVK